MEVPIFLWALHSGIGSKVAIPWWQPELGNCESQDCLTTMNVQTEHIAILLYITILYYVC